MNVVVEPNSWSNSTHKELFAFQCNGNPHFRSRLHPHASTAQELQESSTLGMPTSVEEALTSLNQASEPPSLDNFIHILQRCRKDKDLQLAMFVHVYICMKGLQAQRVLGNHLVPMFVECGSMHDAHRVFHILAHQNEHSWTSLICGYIEDGDSQCALHLFEKMQEDLVHPSKFTLQALLKASARLRCVERGHEIHGVIVREGHESDLFVGNALVDMYATCGSLLETRDVFDKLPIKDVVSWTSLIAGYTEHKCGEEALIALKHMQLEGVSPNAVTFVCSLKACGYIGAIDRGREIHAEILKEGFERNPFVGSTLVDMYAKCGLLGEAREVFDELPVRNTFTWSALITGFSECGLGEEALSWSDKMQAEGVPPDAVAYVCSLKACGSIVAIGKGREIHSEIAKEGFEGQTFIGNTLVDMYCKFGFLAEARDVFDELPVQSVVSWNALVTGYSREGENELAFYYFERMRKANMQPDEITMLSILTTCNHAGLVDKGKTYFEAMSGEYSMSPTVEHCNCMVDLLSRAGQLNEAVLMLKEMPCQPNLVSWSIILDACRKWGNVELGRHAFDCAVRLDRKHPSAFILMSNIYVDAQMWKDAEKIEAMRMKAQADRKELDHLSSYASSQAGQNKTEYQVVQILNTAGHLHEL